MRGKKERIRKINLGKTEHDAEKKRQAPEEIQ